MHSMAKKTLKVVAKKRKAKGKNTPSSTQAYDNDSLEKLSEDAAGKTKYNENSDSGDSDEDLDPIKHKEALDKLKDVDPDFYDFLETNDENLLKFDIESDDDKGSEDEIHEPGEIQGDSDESDFEPEDRKKHIDNSKITLKQVATWQKYLQANKVKLVDITNSIKAFNAAMLHVTPDAEKGDDAYKVEGTGVFNAVVQMCVMYLQPAIKRYLGMESGKEPQKCKHFVKIKNPLISYFNDLLKLIGNVSSSNILTVLLKHLHQMSNFLSCFSRISKQTLKKLLVLWSSGEETVRVLAFLCILRITRNQQATMLDTILKAMYLTYVKNCKFVSPSTWPGINFMRRSLVEMFSLDLNVSYQHVFLYIRQLAIHLRNAIVLQKLESRQAVYNWQYINSIHLWADLLGANCNKPQLQPLIYPLVMITTNVIKLVPTHQYYPLRFHCVQILINLSKESDTFIPILPFLTEVLNDHNFNKKNKKVSMKPLDFSCILRLSKAQLAENAFNDAVIEKVYALLLEYTANISHTVAFPDTVILAIIQIKQFLKTCTVINYTKKMKQSLDKIQENSKFIDTERRKANLSLKDLKHIAAWETNIKNKKTPLSKFFENWSAINKTQKRKAFTKTDDLSSNLPTIKKKKIEDKPIAKSDAPPELFPSDSDDNTDMFEGLCDKTESKQKKKKKKKKLKSLTLESKQDDDNLISDDIGKDIIEDMNIDDW